MTGYETFSDWVQRINRWLAYAGMFLLIPMMLMTFADVIGRGLFSAPITGAFELSSYLLAVFVLLGIAYTHQVKGHVRVTMFVSRLPENGQAFLDICTTLTSMFIIGLLAWQGWVVAMEETTVSEQMRIPQWPFRLLVGLAGACLWLELLLDLVKDTAKLARR